MAAQLTAIRLRKSRNGSNGMGLVPHSYRWSQELTIRYTERPSGAGIKPSVGSIGDSCALKQARAAD